MRASHGPSRRPLPIGGPDAGSSTAGLAIRVPSISALFDAWSPEPLERRPLSDEARERIVDAWTAIRKQASAPPVLVLTLPEAERREGLDGAIAAAVRGDMERMTVDARRHWIRRSIQPRVSRIGIAIFFLALVIAGAIDQMSGEGSAETLISQVFVVLAWVALWDPAYRVFTAASFRLARKDFAQLAAAEIRVAWGRE
jgi:hypothetical protein